MSKWRIWEIVLRHDRELLLDALVLAGCNPVLEGPDVSFVREPPVKLDRYLDVLLTGVRALMMGKRWYGIDCDTGRGCGPFPLRIHGPLAFGCLDPTAKLPRHIGLLIVEAPDEQWDRVPPRAYLDFPDLFEP